MKKHSLLLSLTAITAATILSSCYLPPEAYYPPTVTAPPPAPPTPTPPATSPTPNFPIRPGQLKLPTLESYKITNIKLVKLPPRKTGNKTWDKLQIGDPIQEVLPDVFTEIKANGSRVAASGTKKNHNPNSVGHLTVGSNSLNYQNNKKLSVTLFDLDSTSFERMATSTFTVPIPKWGKTTGNKIVKYTTTHGSVYFQVNFSYKWTYR